MNLRIKDRFTKGLPGDTNIENETRQVENACFSYVLPKIPSQPMLIHASTEVAELLGINSNDIKTEEFLTVFSGKSIIKNTKPYALCYGGHQFGNWAGQLGDGRAIILTEIEHLNQFYALQLKGAGPTPYSRRADGLAVLRSSIREHLCAEAMHYLGVPTTRSLSLILSGDQVLRDIMYSGNAAYEKGAIVCRVAPSFIRFGNFEIFSSRNDIKTLRKLTDFAILNHFPTIERETIKGYIQFFHSIAKETRKMILHWQRVGFVHGVMNTDNMSIHGITIDYGPFGWLEDYNENWTPNTTDNQHKRYRFGNQPEIALWNLYQLANALFPLINDTKPLEKILKEFQEEYEIDYLNMMRSKLGLFSKKETDQLLIIELLAILQLSETDMTLFFRNLSAITEDNTSLKAIEIIKTAFYKPEEIKEKIKEKWLNWFTKYIERLAIESTNKNQRSSSMNLVNPKYVLRNYMSQLSIDAADKGDYSLLFEFHTLLKKPYDEQPEYEKWFAKRPDWARDKVGCSMLSCSS